MNALVLRLTGFLAAAGIALVPGHAAVTLSRQSSDASFLSAPRLRTGDLVFWSNTSMDSLIIQELTDGPYSHCGMIYEDRLGKIWVLDAFPRSGLRVLTLEDYLEPRGNVQWINIALIRYRGALNGAILRRWIEALINARDHFVFDRKMIYEPSDLDITNPMKHKRPLYCAELIHGVLSAAAHNRVIYENDFGRVMAKWDRLGSRASRKGLSPVDLVKLFYMRLYLKDLRNHRNKVLITPNGLLRGGSFETVAETRGISKPFRLKKALCEMPGLQNDS